ncbi:3-ketoacyl-ACP reductase [Phreatobacter stygius]|uniref:3-ketoacyl-ACP reductase n=1 Tax=Phreatobacter stygius TaxID=1940610 RepID=A0A4D7ART4_9HYPH|nr:3-ketoacyl-ACP reductase [Phreatobacter stygius]QCI64124.1 3-ketoacyl-ACP reductase [Phreatobacter stygius]
MAQTASDGPSPVAFVTGAGRGIGRAIALALADRKFRLVVNDLQASPELEETLGALRARGAEAKAVAGDIADLAGHGALVDAAWSGFGRIDCLVNNAGISVKTRGDIFDVSAESFDRLIGTNLRGPFFLTQGVARRMTLAPSAAFRSIITISSMNAEAASPDRAEYCISKIGLSMMSKVFALRLAGEGIHTYEIRPGVIRTAMTAVAKARYDQMFADGFSPISRWGEPEDVGRAVATLASGALAYTTGEIVHVDGGLSISKL